MNLDRVKSMFIRQAVTRYVIHVIGLLFVVVMVVIVIHLACELQRCCSR